MILDYLDLIMFAVLFGSILLGYPVAFTIAGVGVLFALIGITTGKFDIFLLGALSQRIFGIMTREVLIAIPLFVLMGLVLERSRIAEDLLEEMARLFGSMKGGLGLSVVIVGALLAASTGIVGATVVTMALIALPSMLRNGYSTSLAAGTVATAGTLGQIIPPSTLLIILSEVMSNGYQQAQIEAGKFTLETISVGQMFAAALFPGLMLVVVYIVYILVYAHLKPEVAPAMSRAGNDPVNWKRIGSTLMPPLVLIVAVLGSILGGVASPTEAASVGAIGAILLAGFRLSNGASNKALALGSAALVIVIFIAGFMTVRLQKEVVGFAEYSTALVIIILLGIAIFAIATSLLRMQKANLLAPITTNTMTITSMIFVTIIAASVFSLVFIGIGGEERIQEIIKSMPGGAVGALLFVMVLVFVLGFFLDFVEISVILLPIVVPTLILMGHDPVWLAVLLAINLQTSFLTPPFGFSLFYLRGAAPKEVTTGQIYQGVAPYIVLQVLGMAVIWFWPDIATWLPRELYG
ncbi:MAG: TRAP transporter large permease subunit [Cohaesibacteraceae bacterium]|nr:TRAP transporter large permease subunit [Cohaesibacteraceae bacterium]